jgi:hypothetical protein
MIITLIGVVLLGAGFILGKVAKGKAWHIADRLENCQIAANIVGWLITFISVCLIVLNVITMQYSYESKLHERDMLEYRIEYLSDDIIGNEMLYNDVVEFNNHLRWVKRTANNPWTSWFSNHRVAELDYVELD